MKSFKKIFLKEMAHLAKLQAYELAEKRILLNNVINDMKNERRKLNKNIKDQSETLSTMDDDLIEYMRDRKEFIVLGDGRVMEAEKKNRKKAQRQDQKQRAIKEALDDIIDNDLEREDGVKKIREAIGTKPHESYIITVGDIKKKIAEKYKVKKKGGKKHRK